MGDSRPHLIHLLSSTFWGGREQYALDITRSFASRDLRQYTPTTSATLS